MSPASALVRPVVVALAIALLAPAGAVAAWLDPVDLSAASQDPSGAEVAVDARGNAVAVWAAEQGKGFAVQAASRTPGGAWQAPIAISATTLSAPNPQVAIDAQGNAVAVWTRRTDRDYLAIVQSASRPLAGRWQKPVDLSAAGHHAVIPHVAVDPRGNAVAVWQRFRSRFVIAVQAATRPPAGRWQAPVEVSASGEGSSVVPHVAIGANGDAVAVWEDLTTGGIRGAARPAGGPWQPPAAISAPGAVASTVFHGVPQVAVDARGNAVAVWHRPTAAGAIVQAAERAVGTSWSAPVTLSAPGQDASSANVAVDPAGNAVAVWERATAAGIATTFTAQAAVRAAGATWQAPVDLSIASEQPTEPHVAVDAGGTAVAVWAVESVTGPSEGVQAAVRAAGGPWQRPATIVALGARSSALSPRVALGAEGNAVAVWVQDVRTRHPAEGYGGFVVRSADFGPPRPRAEATVAKLRLSPSTFRAGRTVRSVPPRATRVGYTLDIAAGVRFTVQRVSGGRAVRVRGSFTRRRPAGADRFFFNGDIANIGALLAPGRYRLVATPIVAGRPGAAVRAPFRIVR